MSGSTTKTAVVTGGTRGVGLGIAKCLGRDGYNLVLGYSSNTEAAEKAKAELEKLHSIQVVTVAGDIAAPSTKQAIFDAVQKHFQNECTAFVHNAGLFIGMTTSVTEHQPTPDADFDKVWDYYQKVYPQAFERGLQLAQKCTGLKHVITISSHGCDINYPPRVGYETPGQAKAAVEFLTRVHASAVASKGINVNCLIPGYTLTEAWDALAKQMGKSAEELKHFAGVLSAKPLLSAGVILQRLGMLLRSCAHHGPPSSQESSCLWMVACTCSMANAKTNAFVAFSV